MVKYGQRLPSSFYRIYGIYQISKHHQRILSVLVQWLSNLIDFLQEFYRFLLLCSI